MALMKFNILEDAYIAQGQKLIMQYGDGDFCSAYMRVCRDIDNLMKLECTSQEGFGDWIKDVFTHIWEKIKELWNMLVSFFKRIFGKNTLANTPSVHSVINYGQFPEGYVPTAFETAGYTGGVEYFLPSVRTLQNYLARVKAIVALFGSNEFINMMNKFINDIDIVGSGNEEYPMVAFTQFIDHHNSEIRDLMSIDTQIQSRIQRLFGKGTTVVNYCQNLEKLYQPIKPAAMYDRVNPYLAGGWTSGTVFKDFVGVQGSIPAVKDLIAKGGENFKKHIVEPYDAKVKRLTRSMKLNPIQSDRDRFNNWTDQIAAINHVVVSIYGRFTNEIVDLEKVIKINCDAINEDISKKMNK